MKAKIPTLEQYFERLNGYLDKTSRLDSSFEWNHQTREDVLSLLGFKPWIKMDVFDDSEPPECYTNQVWLHPRGLYAVTSPSDELQIIAMVSDYTSNWMPSVRTSSSFSIEHGYVVKSMNVKVDCFEILEDLVSNRIVLKGVLPLKEWTIQTLGQVELESIYYNGLLKEFRRSLNDFVDSKESFHLLIPLVKSYIDEFGDAPPEPKYNNFGLLLSDAVQTILYNDFPSYFGGDVSQSISNLQKKHFKVLSEYLHGNSSKSWKDIKDFCDEEKLVAHPLFLCIDLIHCIGDKKAVKIQEHVQNFLNIQIEKMCSEMTQSEIEFLWTKSEIGRNKFYEGLIFNHELLPTYSLIFKKMGKGRDLSFISDEMFDFSSSKNLPLGYFKMIGNDNLEKNIVSFFNENPLFLNKKNPRFDCFKIFLNKLESDSYLNLFQYFNKVYNEKKLSENLLSKNKIINSRGYRF